MQLFESFVQCLSRCYIFYFPQEALEKTARSPEVFFSCANILLLFHAPVLYSFQSPNVVDVSLHHSCFLCLRYYFWRDIL